MANIRYDNELVSEARAISFTFHGLLITLRPSHAAYIPPSVIICLWKIASTIDTTWGIPASSLLYAPQSLARPGEVHEETIQCFLYAGPSMIMADVPCFSLKDLTLKSMAVNSIRAEVM